MLSVIFLVLLSSSIQSATADTYLVKEMFKNDREIDVVRTYDSNYQVYLQTVLRNGDSQLISVTEGMHGFVIQHQLTDHVFDTLMGKKEIVTIDNIKYEKVQYTFSPTLEQRTAYQKTYPIFEEIPIEYVVTEDDRAKMKEDIRDYYRWVIHYCADVSTTILDGYQCIPIFQSFTPITPVTYTDVVTHQWTILRVLN